MRFLHKCLTNRKGTLVSPEFFGEHFALLRLAVDHIQRVHRAVADVSDQVHAFQSRCETCNGGVALRVDAHIVDIDVVSSLFVGEIHFRVFHQILPERRLLPACPSQWKTGGNHNVRLGNIFGFQFLGNRRKGEDIIVLVVHLFGNKLLVSLADEIIFAVVGQHIAGEQRLCVKTKNTGRKIVIRRFHIAITVVDADDFCVVHCFHSSSFLLRCSLQIF